MRPREPSGPRGAQHPVHHGAKTVTVLDRDPEQLGDHRDREREGQIGDQIELFTHISQP